MTTAAPEFLEWATRGASLLDRARRTLRDAPAEKVRALSERVPESITSADTKLRVVFAGQYSAGKSSIVRVLTGRSDIAVGAGITTQTSNVYEWDGVEVIDTPGVHTEIRPDHDEISYRAIAEADLLVFVVTNEGFDSHLAAHFRRLAIERDKAHEMMVVVNKMRRCAAGNTIDTQNVIREDLRKVLSPFSPEDLRTTFIDAEAAHEGHTCGDQELARVLLKKSGFEAFTGALNDFIRDAGLAGRYTTALYALEQVLQEAIAAESSGDMDVDGLEELLVQRRRAVVEAQQQIPRTVEGRAQRSAAMVRDEGRKVAEHIHGDGDPKVIDQELRAAQARVEQYASELAGSVSVVLSESMEKLGQRVSQIAESELAKELLPRLLLRIEGQLCDVEVSPGTFSKMRKASDVSRRLGEFLLRNSFNPKSSTFAGLFKLNQYSGTATHGAVKSIGGFFGKSFKPWEAVKWTRTIANVGRVLAVAGTVLTFVLQVKEDVDAARLERDLRESRGAVRSGFNDAAHAIERHFDDATRNYLGETLAKEVAEVDAQLSELRSMQQTRGKLFQDLVGLLEDTRSAIRNMHARSAIG